MFLEISYDESISISGGYLEPYPWCDFFPYLPGCPCQTPSPAPVFPYVGGFYGL
jgi:hypothetical protein